METNQKLPIKFSDVIELTIPEFGSRPALKLDITPIKNAEMRIIEARVVNGATYCELEYTFNEGYREARKHLSTIGYEITQAEKALRKAKSEALLDKYNQFLKDKGFKDSSCIRDAFLEQQEDYVKAQDRIDMLKALESLMDGKIKVFENVCRYLKKEIEIQTRTGISGNHYTNGR